MKEETKKLIKECVELGMFEEAKTLLEDFEQGADEAEQKFITSSDLHGEEINISYLEKTIEDWVERLDIELDQDNYPYNRYLQILKQDMEEVLQKIQAIK